MANDDGIELSKPPAVDYRLLDYFSGNGIAAKTNRYERENGGGAPDPERALINSGAVGFRQHSEAELLDRAAAAVALREVRRLRGDKDWAELDEPDAFEDQRVSRGQRQRSTAAVVARVSAAHVAILCDAYGPQDVVPALREPWDPEPGRDVTAAMKTAALRSTERHARLGPWRLVLLRMPRVLASHAGWVDEQRIAGHAFDMSLATWLVEVMTTKRYAAELDAAKLDVFRAVREAWHAYRSEIPRRAVDTMTYERSKAQPWDM